MGDLCRRTRQITRLRDLNGDGEADAYDNFNNDTVVAELSRVRPRPAHRFQGDFYYCKGCPMGTQRDPSPLGDDAPGVAGWEKLEVFATGLRAPNGMTVGPDDTVLVGDNRDTGCPPRNSNLVKPAPSWAWCLRPSAT